jgi:hypothetical protein
MHLAKCQRLVGEKLQALLDKHDIEAGSLVRESMRIPLSPFDPNPIIPRLGHGNHGGAIVETHHLPPWTDQTRRTACDDASAAGDIQHSLACHRRETCEEIRRPQIKDRRHEDMLIPLGSISFELPAFVPFLRFSLCHIPSNEV